MVEGIENRAPLGPDGKPVRTLDLEETRNRTPLFEDQWTPTLEKMRLSEHAPFWNVHCGDQITPEDRDLVLQFEGRLKANDPMQDDWPRLFALAKNWGEVSLWHRRVLAEAGVPMIQGAQGNGPSASRAGWERIPTMDRGDLQRRIHEICPLEADLESLIVNHTSGTTGHPLKIPTHPAAVGSYHPLIDRAQEICGVPGSWKAPEVAAIQVCHQNQTIVYNTVHSLADGAGFAKVNLVPQAWFHPEDPGSYLLEMAPGFLSGDPWTFLRMVESGLKVPVTSLLSTAIALDLGTRKKLESFFDAPVVDLYSLNETGPLGVAPLDQPGCFELLPGDIHLEFLDQDGRGVPDGEWGELTITGGRNPYLPLLRYRTGDWARRISAPGKPLRFELREGRQPVDLFDSLGNLVNPIDAARIMIRRSVPRYQLVQKADGSLVLRTPELAAIQKEPLLEEVARLFGQKFGASGPTAQASSSYESPPTRISWELLEGDGKILPFVREG